MRNDMTARAVLVYHARPLYKFLYHGKNAMTLFQILNTILMAFFILFVNSLLYAVTMLD